MRAAGHGSTHHLSYFTRVLLRYPPVDGCLRAGWYEPNSSRWWSRPSASYLFETKLTAIKTPFLYISSSDLCGKRRLLIEHWIRTLELEMPQTKIDWFVNSAPIYWMPIMCQALFWALQKTPKSCSAWDLGCGYSWHRERKTGSVLRPDHSLAWAMLVPFRAKHWFLRNQLTSLRMLMSITGQSCWLWWPFCVF